MNHKLIFQVADAIETEGENGNFYMEHILDDPNTPVSYTHLTLPTKA